MLPSNIDMKIIQSLFRVCVYSRHCCCALFTSDLQLAIVFNSGEIETHSLTVRSLSRGYRLLLSPTEIMEKRICSHSHVPETTRVHELNADRSSRKLFSCCRFRMNS